MNLSELINEILSEWAYRCDDGMPNPKNPIHLNELSEVLSEMGLSHIKNTLVENLLMEKGKTPERVKEAEGSFTNPILNKKIKYKNTKGEDAEGIVGNLLRLPAEHPGRKAAEALLPADDSPERDAINKDLGGQGQAAKPEDGKDKKGGEEAGGGEEEKAKAAQAMFDPKNDPAMAARMDKEKEVQSQLAKDAEADKEAEKEQEPKEDDGFKPIDAKDVAKEMPQADPETFNGDSDIPDGVTPEQLDQFNTDIAKVAQQVADAKAKGEPAPNINLCDVTVPGTNLYCDDNLGIPRDEMPQFKGTAQPGSRAASMEVDKDGEVDTEPVFKEMLKEKGIKTLQTQIPADKLKATQKDLVGAKVVGMMGALEKDPNHPKITAPIYVSRDGHVIDGHHRWAAIVAYNAAHPDSPIPMKTTVLDMDIKDAIPMANKFAEDMGIAAKKADANKEDVPSEPTQREPANDDPESKAQQFKGKSSGENIQTMEMEGGGFVYGTKHGNTAMVDDILDDVKSKIPKERWKDVVFVGEGGATGDSGELEFHDEMDYAAPKFKEIGAGVDTWDGDEMDVHNDQSKLYQKQKEKTGFNDSQVKAGNWASMIGQGEGTDTMSPNDYLDDEGKGFLQDAAKEAGFPPIENWDEPTEQDMDTLYRLSFPEDNGDKETKINDIQVAFNDARDEHLIEKNKELTAQGKIPITIAGESHVDLVDKMTRKGKETSKTTPKEPSKENGGTVYSLGGGYYSDTPNGPAQYMVSESLIEKLLVERNNDFGYLLFEAVVTKKTSKGNDVKLVTIDPKNQEKATADAAASNKKAGAVPPPPPPPPPTSVPKLTDKVRQKISKWTEKEKAFFDRNEGAPGSKERRSLGQALRDKAAGAWKAIKKGAAHEVEEFKEAGIAVGKFFKGEEISEKESKAFKAVMFKVVTTALFGAAMGGLGHGVAAFGKHVAIEFIPHVIGETILKGVGKAAVFADMEGEAETDANMIKFAEMVSKGLEEMEITPEMMEQMVDSYNEKKENGEVDSDTTTTGVKAEHLHLVDELMLEMIYGFINEATYPKSDDGKFWVKSKSNGNVYTVITPKPKQHDVPDKKEIKKAQADSDKNLNAKSDDVTTKTPPAKKLGPGDFRQTGEKDLETPAQTPQPSADKESGRQEMDSPKTEQEKEKMRKFTDKSVTSSLQLTKSDVKAQEKQAKDEYEKAVKAWEKGGKKGPKPQFTKGLGAGSPESRAGESAVVKGCLALRDDYVKCISKSKDKKGCYEKARAIARKKLESFLGADSYLTNEWIDSAMNTLDLIHEEIGFENIEEIGWDNQQGRALVGSQGHGTSADMFIKGKPTKQFPKGKRIGISLKKDLKVFVFNGGWAKLEKVVTDRGFKLSEKSTMEYYNKRRYEELEKIRNFTTENNADFCNDFENLKNNPNRISKKPQNVQSRVSDILKKTGKSDLSKVNCEDFINSIINERPPSVDSMKIIGDLCKTSTNPSLKDAYKRLRALDREMTDGIANDFMKPENQAVVKKLVRDETHISDILFADNPNLDELKVVFGTEPAISMKPEKLAELFGIQKLHEQYKNEKDPKKKAALRKKMEDIIDSKITINNKKGVMSVAITITDENGAESQLPLFEAKIRTRGFGNSPTFEMPQTVFGGLAYKYGHTRYNEWQDDDKEIVVSSAIKDIEDEFSEELEFLDDKTSAEILKRLKDLEIIYPNSPALKKFKKKYLNSNNKSVQTAKEKAKVKKK